MESGFFNSVNGDRTYNARDISRYFEHIISNGLYKAVVNNMKVSAAGGMSLHVAAGAGIIDSQWFRQESGTHITIPSANAVLPRIDSVVVRLDLSDSVRSINLDVVEGTPATAPTATAPVNSDNVRELVLAHVYVKAAAEEITAADITDTRSDDALCGWAHVQLAAPPSRIPTVKAYSADGVAYTATVDNENELYNGMLLTIIPEVSSTSKAITLDVNGLGAKMVRLPLSFNNAAMTAPDADAYYTAGRPITLQYDAAYANKGAWKTLGKQQTSAQDLYGLVPIEGGGTKADNAIDALNNLGGVPKSYTGETRIAVGSDRTTQYRFAITTAGNLRVDVSTDSGATWSTLYYVPAGESTKRIAALSKAGDIFGVDTPVFRSPSSAGSVGFHNGETAKFGAGIWLYGNDHPTGKGRFRLQVYDNANEKYRQLDGSPDGTLRWNGQNVLTAPQMLVGVEYPTGEFFKGKPVYCKIIEHTAIPPEGVNGFGRKYETHYITIDCGTVEGFDECVRCNVHIGGMQLPRFTFERTYPSADSYDNSLGSFCVSSVGASVDGEVTISLELMNYIWTVPPKNNVITATLYYTKTE